MASDDSDVFYVEQSSSELSPQRHNSPNILNSTEICEQHTARMPSVSTITSPEPYIFTIHDDSNEPTMPYGFGRQLPIVPPSLNDLNLPPNPFNILNTMAVVTQTQDDNEQYSPESPEPSLPSPISTPPMSVRTPVGRRPIPQLTTTLFTRKRNHDGSTGHLPWAKHLNPKMNPGGSTSYHRVPHRRHHLHEGRN